MSDSGPGYRAFRTFPPLLDPHSLPAGSVLAFAPHPDDEILGCGGMLAFHRERGDPVRVVHMTGGEAGDPEERQEGDLVAVRRAESLAALKVLGVTELVGLGYPDGGLDTGDPVIERVEREIAERGPSVVYSPSPLECHPDHLACCWVVGRALARARASACWLTYEVNHPTLASCLFDITPRVDRKREALEQFESQLRYQDVVGKCLAGGYARTVNVELRDVQYAEAFLRLEPGELPAVFEELRALSRRLGLLGPGEA